MFVTSEIIRGLPKRLQAFKRYIEKYACGYIVGEKTKSIVFYHKETLMPYVFVIDKPQVHYVEILVVNYQGPCYVNFISNDMNAFLAVMRECKESNG